MDKLIETKRILLVISIMSTLVVGNGLAGDCYCDGENILWAYGAVLSGGLLSEGDSYVEGYLTVFGEVTTFDDLTAWHDLDVGGDATIDGKLNLGGSIDPPFILCDTQTRQQIIDRVKVEVPPAKQTGAALFFNSETKRLEVYVPCDGKFYDLQGKPLHALAKVELPTVEYETVHYLDPATGEVKTRQKPMRDKFEIREGYELDAKTGEFISKASGRQASREEALIRYVAKEATYYDLTGNLIGDRKPRQLPKKFLAKQDVKKSVSSLDVTGAK